VSADRFVTFQFCDDIRQEVGNKFSLIGCYGGVVQIAPIPSVMPKLCAAVRVHTPIARPFKKLVARIIRDDKPIAEITFPPEAFSIDPRSAPDGAQRHALIAMFVMAPFPVETPCTLRVEAETEEGIISAGSFWIQAAAQLPISPELVS
jgi:hypothetical protein